MNGWHLGITSAARDRMHVYRLEAERARLLRAAAPARRLALWRRASAAALHRLADVLAPQLEDGKARSARPELGASGGPPIA